MRLSLLRLARVTVFTSLGLAAVPAIVSAAPLLTQIGNGSWTFSESSNGGISDGTSNTILFGEVTRLRICVPNSTLPSTPVDGQSNTIQFSESTGIRFAWTSRAPGQIVDGSSNTILFPEAECYQGVVPPAPIGVRDGSSNTIVFGEHPIRFLPGTRFDVCFSGVQVRDGSSNTILVGENESQCFRGAGVSDDLAVPAPSVLTLVLAALGGFGIVRRTRG